jgi:hypothetical protein
VSHHPVRRSLAAPSTATLRVELIESNRGKPPLIVIDWPPAPTVCESAQLDAVVAAAMRILANSVVTLAGIRVQRKL